MQTMTWFEISQDYGVLEVRPAATPGFELELHVERAPAKLVAWWRWVAVGNLGHPGSLDIGRA